MKARHSVLIALVSASPAGLMAQGSVPGRIADSRAELADVFRADARNGERVDYRTVILHSDGSTTTITDKGDTHNVTGKGRTEQTVGRGVTHEQVIATHYRPSQGDILYLVDRLNFSGQPTRIYSSPRLKSDMAQRAAGNAYGQRMQQQQTAQWEAEQARRERERQQQRRDELGADRGGSHDREVDRPVRESHPDVRGGNMEVNGVPDRPHLR